VADIPDDGRASRRSLLIGAAGAVVILGGGAGGFDYEINQHPGLRRRLFGCGSTPAIPASHYTVTTGTFSSDAMHADVPWEIAIPSVGNERAAAVPPTALVIALPGMGGQPHDMVTGVGLPGWATAAKLNIAFASPGAGGSTYYHPRADGTNSLEMVTEEFIPMVEKRFEVGGSRAKRAMFGWSMGGFGSLLIAAHRADLVCAAVGSSPAVFPSYDAAITGHPLTFDSEADWEKWGLWDHLDTLDNMPVRIDCGDADPFAATARQLLKRIPGAVGQISSGCHLTSFWRRNAAVQLQFLASHLAT
jgi:pimeloyl-ACP methyl ester carboxylesterase